MCHDWKGYVPRLMENPADDSKHKDEFPCLVHHPLHSYYAIN